MMTIGGSAKKCHEQIFRFLKDDIQPAIIQVIDYTKNTLENFND